MSWLDRLRGRKPKGEQMARAEIAAAEEHLKDFAATRAGVEAFIEPPTTLDRLLLLLVAHDGESTRRRIPDAAWGRGFAKRAQIPVFDALVSGYPQRLRDYNRRQKLRPGE